MRIVVIAERSIAISAVGPIGILPAVPAGETPARSADKMSVLRRR